MTEKQTPLPDLSGVVDVFVEAALAAGAAILQFWRKGAPVRSKADGSPVTQADLAANSVILERLSRALPAIPVVSEEAEQPAAARGADAFILVDPLDGTKEFIHGTEEFTVNIALIHLGKPICGVVFAPAMGRIWTGCATRARSGALAIGATDPATIAWSEIGCRAAPEKPVAVVSRSHLDQETKDWLARNKCGGAAPSGSSIKFCLVAEGAADVYPRFGRTMEWDTAAGDAVLRAAGGRTETIEGAAFIYGKGEDGYANPGFVAKGARGG
ncbi:3'(2'),5'-bisphosphate nucleotidase [Rhodoblastus sphagnicola]|uniref:3'(2'),5'-bisphosphate nucleotidase CysQ n=1 Tax=Rhodoblastus sphagnicola TaxID=333368 RepID=A0A2S6N8N2_9HYPH|nr:3'(2'),5'-bisphosphate nucleotidase CysQ [Rhodoblastus sphagnicola]MBB4199957.1 3'(2'), 5'-bisphosphate nucleotidase [Rhodoblastus sphagnicola]PPQ30975.1 3'(2'),5'-bisphosphate nucleotidase [Rhodoblastus sphagnicola]